LGRGVRCGPHGLDALVEQYDLGGETLVERYPKLRYVLG
jgi:thiosulfate dehydrogenase [quinone] large subunit